MEAVIDWILAHPQPEAAPAPGQASGGIAGASNRLCTHFAHASMHALPSNSSAAAAVSEMEGAIIPKSAPTPTDSEFEYFPNEPSATVCELGHVTLARAALDADGVISSVDGILPHIPTVAKAFRERLRACSDLAAFQSALQQLWKRLFRPHDVSCWSPLAMTHAAAFEFAINELLLSCEERRYMELVHTSERQALAPLHFLKQDPAFLECVSSQIGLTPSVSSVRSAFGHFSYPCAAALLQLMHFQVLPRLLRTFLEMDDVSWFVTLFKAVPPSCDFGCSFLEENAEISAFYKQVI